MKPLFLLVSFIAADLANGTVYSPYPCLWIDNETNAQLDLHLFKGYTLSKNIYTNNYNGYMYYTPCSNNLEGNDGASMATIKLDSYLNQTLNRWNNGTVAPELVYNQDYRYWQWIFSYSDPTIECVANHSDVVTFNITWQYSSSYFYPTITSASVDPYPTPPDTCHVVATAVTQLAQPDYCSLTFNSITSSIISINLTAFRNHMFEYNIDPQRVIRYTPCNSIFSCHNSLTQAIIKNTSSNEECDAYLAVYVNAIAPYNNAYYQIVYDSAKQMTQYLYKTGENCTIADNETIPRQFYVYWQCNTLAQPYKILDAIEFDVCTDELAIESIIVCPGFAECVYYDQNSKLNLTSLIGRNIATQFDNDESKWLFYSVCQRALSSQLQTKKIGTLYNDGSIMAGEYVSFNETAYNFSRKATSGVHPKYYYDSTNDEWIFQYSDGNLCSLNSLFSVTWKCGGLQAYTVEQAYTSPCTDSIIISTSLC